MLKFPSFVWSIDFFRGYALILLIAFRIILKVGVTLPQLGKQATRENLIRFASKAEESGFDSVWVLERLLWPIKPRTPYVATADGSLPLDYQSVTDPLETLSFVAAHTQKISLGTSVIDMLFHTPVMLGRRFATLDVLSEGRAICGLGIGWSEDEYQVSNTPFKNRGKRANEFLEALKRVWTDDVVQFKGEYYNIPPSKIGPKPIQRPHIPIYMGGFSPATFSRIVKYDTNGWLGVSFGPLEQIQTAVNTIKDLATKGNKDPNNFKVILLSYPNISESKSSGAQQRIPMTGTIEEIGSDINKFNAMGVEHIVLSLFFSPVYPNIDRSIEISKQLLQYAK